MCPAYVMNGDAQFLIFRLDEQRYALALGAVHRVVAAVEVTPLPHAPAIVTGIINAAGQVIPVCSLRRRFGLSDRAINPQDQFVVARTTTRLVALVVDETQGVQAWPQRDIVAASAIVAQSDQIQGIIKLSDGLVLIQNLEKLLSTVESRALDEALRQEVSHAT